MKNNEKFKLTRQQKVTALEKLIQQALQALEKEEGMVRDLNRYGFAHPDYWATLDELDALETERVASCPESREDPKLS